MLLCLRMASTRNYVVEPQLAEAFCFFLFFSHHQLSMDRMQFYYWKCLLMIPNYPVEHSGEGQFQVSNLCCNHRGNHTYNNAVKFTSQQQKARECKTIVGEYHFESVWAKSCRVWCKVEKGDIFCGEIETNPQNLHIII